MVAVVTKPDWPEEPWEEWPQGGIHVQVAASTRALACVNALAGIRNPAAVAEVIAAIPNAVASARESLHRCGGADTRLAHINITRLARALAALDEEPAE